MREEEYPQHLVSDYDTILLAFPKLSLLRKSLAQAISEYFADENIKILEIGSGHGESTEFILKKLPGVKIIAVDKNQEMVNDMKKKFNVEVERGAVEIICEDGLKYLEGTKSASIDCFTSSWTIHNFKKEVRQRLLHEVYRVLNDKSLVVIMDKYYSDDRIEAQKSFDAIVKIYRGIARKTGKIRLFEKLIEHEVEDRSEELIMREKESIEIMKKIGFRDIKILDRVGRDAVLVARKRKNK